MPVMDGIETTKRIRTDAAFINYQSIPIIAMTANALPEDEVKCIAAGMNGYMTKPINLKELQHALEDHNLI